MKPLRGGCENTEMLHGARASCVPQHLVMADSHAGEHPLSAATAALPRLAGTIVKCHTELVSWNLSSAHQCGFQRGGGQCSAMAMTEASTTGCWAAPGACACTCGSAVAVTSMVTTW